MPGHVGEVRSEDPPYPGLRPGHLAVLIALEVLIGLIVARFGIRFDGFMDLHRTLEGEPVPITLAVIDQLVSLLLGIAVLAVLLRAWRARVSVPSIAMVGVVTRLPLIVLAAVVLLLPLPGALLATVNGPGLPLPSVGLLVGGAVLLGAVVMSLTFLTVAFVASPARADGDWRDWRWSWSA